jgi:hypothetical protein
VTGRPIALLAALALFAAPLAAEAQRVGKIFNIGALRTIDSQPWEAFREGLRQLGAGNPGLAR